MIEVSGKFGETFHNIFVPSELIGNNRNNRMLSTKLYTPSHIYTLVSSQDGLLQLKSLEAFQAVEIKAL